jgi:hypothetical protein
MLMVDEHGGKWRLSSGQQEQRGDRIALVARIADTQAPIAWLFDDLVRCAWWRHLCHAESQEVADGLPQVVNLHIFLCVWCLLMWLP